MSNIFDGLPGLDSIGDLSGFDGIPDPEGSLRILEVMMAKTPIQDEAKRFDLMMKAIERGDARDARITMARPLMS